ncbi:MAG: signal peptide peptidase SppA [Anaerolineae bacterium]|nr:signal peptide peptidase SppA [Anaerolineae bacterium]
MKPFLKSVQHALAYLNPFRYLRRGIFAFGNWRRRRSKLDWIMLTLPAQIPALPEPRSWIQQRVLGKPSMSLADFRRLFERIADDPRPKGVILTLRGLQLSLADLQTLRGLLLKLRASGKRVICYAQSYDNATYTLASAADEIVLQPGGELMTIGLHSEVTFLKDALDWAGVQMDSVAITPYKGALDSLTRSEPSTEGREQLNWLLDSRYEQMIDAITEGRKTTSDAIKAMIDSAPHLDTEALKAGYVDAVETEEGLHRRIASEQIVNIEFAEKKLLKKWRRSPNKYVALLHVSGTMIQGESRKPPVNLPLPFIGDEVMGDVTVVQQVRALMKNKTAAAVILYIESGGGSAAAAEAMTAALAELAADRPLVVYMNGVAASGGYYIATPAQWIVAQPGTITGSIGVISAKAVTGGLYARLRVNRTSFSRGANADFFSDSAPFNEAQRARMRASIERIYQQFIDHVSKSRHLTTEQVDAVGGGRVWTGQQALQHGLVDQLGDLQTALKKARELAKLPDDAPLVRVGGKLKPLPAQLAEATQPAAYVEYVNHNLQNLCSGAPLTLLPFEMDKGL